MIMYTENGKYAFFNDLKFTRDNKTGYYLNSTKRLRLHRAVWEYYNGSIPEDMQVHHKDEDVSNNDITNFELVPISIHQKYHGSILTQDERNWRKKNMDEKARPKAKEWHKSEEGREWHKKHFDEMKDKFYEEKAFTCEQCGKQFSSAQVNSRFCSNNCKSAWRRAQGLDDEVRTCEYCGKQFSISKYAKPGKGKYCSKSCSSRASPRLPQLRKDKSN